MTRPTTATVTKRFVTVPTTRGKVTLFEGTELALERRPMGGYLGSIASGQQSITGELLLTDQQAADWLVFRTPEALGYREKADR